MTSHEDSLCTALLGVCEVGAKAGLDAGQVISALARAIGALGGQMILDGGGRKEVHDLFETSTVLMAQQANVVVAFSNLKKQGAK